MVVEYSKMTTLKNCKGRGIVIGLGCGTPSYLNPFKKGLCDKCWNEFLFNSEQGKIYMEKKNTTNKNKNYKIRKISPKTRERNKNKRDALNVFFKKHESLIIKNKAVCDNCGAPLRGSYWEVAHILPKSKFPSISTNDNNILYLGAGLSYFPCECHKEFDAKINNEEELMKMPVYSKALKKLSKIKSEIKERKKEYFSFFEE